MKQVVSWRRMCATFTGAVLITLATSGIAFAAGSNTALAPIGSGAYGSVLATQTIPASGGVVSATDGNGAAYAVTVPAGSFPAPAEIALISPSLSQPALDHIIAEVDIIVVRNGQPYTEAFTKPLTLTITAPALTNASIVRSVSISGHETAVNGVVTRSSPLIANAGIATFHISSSNTYIHTYMIANANASPMVNNIGNALLVIVLSAIIISGMAAMIAGIKEWDTGSYGAIVLAQLILVIIIGGAGYMLLHAIEAWL